MKMLVSDYDDTLYTGNFSVKLNVGAIKKYRKNGNKFVIASARDFKSLKNETVKHNIPYDYLICYDGNAVYNKDDKLIYIKYFNGQAINCIKELINNDMINSVILFDEKGCVDNSNINSNNDFMKKEVDYKRICAAKITTKKISDLSKIRKYIKQNMADTMVKTDYGIILFANPINNKANAIHLIKSINDIDDENIYTIGNDINDLKMIKEFNGYNMIISDPRLYVNSNGVCTSVRQLIKKIEK